MDVTAIAVAAIAAVVGLIAGIVGTAYKSRKELETSYDIDRRKARIFVYKKLWTESAVLSLYSPPKFDRDAATQFSAELRRWYFEDGGMYLSKSAQEAYLNLQQALEETLSRDDDPMLLREILRKKASALRSALVRDIATRDQSLLSRRKKQPPETSDEDRKKAIAEEIESELSRQGAERSAS
jgi:hypothetical protein